MFGQERLINAIVKAASTQTVIHKTFVNLQVGNVSRQIVDAEEELQFTCFLTHPDSAEVENAALKLNRLKNQKKVLLYKPPLE